MLVDTTGTGFVIIDDQGQVLDANLEYVHLTGHMSLEEIAGRNMIEWTAAYAKDTNAEAVSQCMMDGYIRNFEIDYVNASGTIIPIEINATVLRSGDAVQILALCRDITERKRAEVALVESEVFNRGLVENLPDYIVVYGTDGKILYVNPATERALGYNAEELVGTSVLSYVALECRDVATAKMAARREGDNPSAYELDIIAQDGQRRSVIAKGTPIQYHDRPAILM
ncbi:MAG: PAS domain-containing protein, partial [Deltaproteobacteria bacterium]